MDARDRDDVRAKAQEVVDQASDTYRKPNGHSGSIEGDDGEKCWIVPFDAMEELRAALVGALPALSTHTAAGAGPVGEAVDTVWFYETRSKARSDGPGGVETYVYGNWYEDFSRARPVEGDRIRNVRPFYARPVDEPGEVEKVSLERDDWRKSFEAMNEKAVSNARERNAETRRAETAEAALADERKVVLEIVAAAGKRADDHDIIQHVRDLAETRERLEKVADGNRPLPYGRDELGRFVRDAWIRWAQTQPNPKPSWLLAYDELPEPDKEADRQIGEAIARWTLIGTAARAALTGDAQGLASDLAELSKTRERLEKRVNALEATLDRFLNEPPGFVVPLWIRTAARAALTGDAQEVGR